MANPYRHDGGTARNASSRTASGKSSPARASTLCPNFPITVYYAFKQGEADGTGESSTGWETPLEGMIRSGWVITSTWPVRSERAARSVGLGANALASSIVLSLRPILTTRR